MPNTENNFKTRLRAAAPKLRSDINNSIQRILEIGRTYEPLTIISNVALTLQLSNSEDPASARATGEVEAEHLVSLFLSQSYPSNPETAVPDVIQETFDLLKSIHSNISIYYSAESHEPDDLASDLRLFSHFVRGDAYALHVRRQFLELAVLHDEFLKERLGFDAKDFIDLLEYAVSEINKTANTRWQRKLEVTDKLVGVYLAEHCNCAKEKSAEIISNVLSDEHFCSEHPGLINELIDAVNSLRTPEVLAVCPRNSIDLTILECLSARFGENERFIEIANWRGWPLNPSIINSRPCIEHAGNYYLPLANLASRNILELIEGAIKNVDVDYWKDRYLPTRDAYLERTAVALISSMLPGGRSFNSLRFCFSEDGQQKSGETDGLIIYDDALIIIEAKAGKFSAEAQRGSSLRLTRDLGRLLDQAFVQGSRLLDKLRCEHEVVLRDENGRIIVTLANSRFEYCFIVLVSFESLSFLQSSLAEVKKLGFLAGGKWPWAVSLSDLRVISELTEHPSAFIHYLLRRLETNEAREVHAQDELDYFGYYMAGQLFFPAERKVKANENIMLNYTEVIDEYYAGQIGWHACRPKPKQILHEKIGVLITALESQRPPHHLRACVELLDIDGKLAHELCESLHQMEDAFKNRRRSQALILQFHEKDSLLVVGCSPDGRCPPLAGFPRFGSAVKAKRPAKITAIFYTPPFPGHNICVDIFDRESTS